jgi:hypothetical protein
LQAIIAFQQRPAYNFLYDLISGEVPMKNTRHVKGAWCILLVLTVFVSAGCESMNQAQKGAAGGAAIGALAGQIIGGNTAGTLIGAGVGVGVGYLIGNEMDKKDAKKQQAIKPEETQPLVNTAWQVLSINPKPKKPFNSMVVRFDTNGTAITTMVFPGGKTETRTERYRIVGDTLILNHNDYLINARYQIDGNRMYLQDGKFTAVLQRV